MLNLLAESMLICDLCITLEFCSLLRCAMRKMIIKLIQVDTNCY